MASRWPPAATSGTFSLGSGKNDELISAFETFLISITCSNGAQAWEPFSDINGIVGPFDKIWRSKGDRSITSQYGSEWDGDARIFIRLDKPSGSTTQLTLVKYDDFSNFGAGASGSRFTATETIVVNASSTLQYWMYGNEYYTSLIFSQSTTKNITGIGETTRKYVQPSNRGRCFFTGTAISGNNITISVDRDMTDPASIYGAIQPSATVHINSITTTGQTLQANSQIVAKVSAVSSNSITFANLPFAINGPAIIGYICQPIVVLTTNSNYANSKSISLLAGSGAQLGPTVARSNDASIGAADYSPQFTGMYHAVPVSLRLATGGSEGMVGQLYHDYVVAFDSAGSSPAQGTLFYDVRTGKYFEIFGDFAAHNTSYKPMFPYVGDITGKTVISGVIENDFNITTKLPNQGGQLRLPSGGRFRDVVLYDFELPSGTLPVGTHCSYFNILNNSFDNSYNITQMSSSLRQYFHATDTCNLAQAPFSLGIRGTTFNIRGRTDPYTCYIGKIPSNGPFFPLSHS